LIFVTVGTHGQPFTRLLGSLGAIDDELVVQYGTGAPPPGVAEAVAFMPFEQMLANFRRAEKVITHAGVGSVLCATREGHLPLVVPRRHDLGEHVDEHQAELTRRLDERGSVIAVWETAELPGLLAAAPERGAAGSVGADSGLTAALRGALRGDQAPSER
jgi:UDP-N-acetylglucosamine transferase subunit ALG13